MAHVHLRALQKASLSLEVEGWRSAPLVGATSPPLHVHPFSSSTLCHCFTLPPSPPLCPDHCPVHPSAQEQWSTLKEKQEERGARCHRVACLLTKPLKAAPHKSKRNIMVIVSPRATEIPLLFCPPLFLGFFGNKSGQSQGWRFFIRGVLFLSIWRL